MWPVLFTWRGIVLRSYPVMIYVALLVTVLLTVMLAQRAGLDPDRTAWTMLLSFIPGFIGARLFYAVRHWHHFRHDPSRIARRSEGGLSLTGGIIGMLAGLVPLIWFFALPAAPFFDALALAMLAGIAIAKSACLLNGCCHGRPTDHWSAITLPDHTGLWTRRFPSQFFEMIWALVALVVLLLWRLSSPEAGLLACGAFVLHPVGRLLLQKLREESAAENAAVQIMSFVLIVSALTIGAHIAM